MWLMRIVNEEHEEMLAKMITDHFGASIETMLMPGLPYRMM